jgi:hypothetical protein
MRDFVADGYRLSPFHKEADWIDLFAAYGVLTQTGSKTGCRKQKKLEI